MPLPAPADAERQLLAAVFERAPAFMCILRGRDHVVELANPALRRIVPGRDVVGRPAREAVPEIVSQGFLELLDRVLVSGEPFVGQGMTIRLAGGPDAPPAAHVIDFVCEPLPGADGRPGGIFVHGVDVTEHRRTADALRASEAELQAVIGAMSDVILVIDRDGIYRKVARSARERLVRPADQLLGYRLHDVFEPARADRFLAAVRQALDERAPVELEYELELHGESLWFMATVTPAADDTVVWVARDISARVRAEAALRKSEAHFRSLIENATDMVSVIEPDGTFRYVSPAHARVFGLARDSLVGHSAMAGIHPDDMADAATALVRALSAASAEPSAAQFRYRHQDGSWRTIAATFTNLSDDPAVGGVVVNSHDVTDRVQLEERLRQAQKMEAVGQLAGGVAHDFNNLLTVILANVELALADLPPAAAPHAGLAPGVQAELHAGLHEVAEAARRASALTRQLLAFSRKQLLQPQRLDVNETITGMGTLLRRLIGEDVVLVTELAAERCPVEADPGQLGQVVLNLAVNARDAMPDGGTLCVRTRALTLDGAAAQARGELSPGRYVALEVEDSGTGIDAAALPHIFEPFYTTKHVGHGTGLGLATVYGIVRQSGGWIAADSALGRGSRFTVLLPRVEEEAPAPAPAAEPPPPAAARAPGGDTGTVLLVEDEDAVRAVLRRVLEREGLRVREAANGAEALDVWRALGGEVDLLLTDVVMPEMGGPRLAALLRAERPDLRVLLMSGYDRDGALATERLPLLRKPLQHMELIARVREMLATA